MRNSCTNFRLEFSLLPYHKETVDPVLNNIPNTLEDKGPLK